MAIQLPNGLNIVGTEPVDMRILLSKAEMLAAKKARMPEKYFAICKDDGKLYMYDSNNELDETTGRFRLYEAPVDSSDLSVKLPDALSETMSSEGGAEAICDALFDSDHFQTTVDNKIDIAISLIQAIDSN